MAVVDTYQENGRTIYKRRYTLAEVQTKLLDNLPKLKAMDEASQDDSNAAWAGADWEKSVKYLTEGWKAGVAKLDVQPVGALHEALRPKPEWDVSGSEVDMGAFLSGVPECMTEMVRRRRAAQVVRIGVDKAISCACPASRIEAMGRQILLLVEGLRLGGVPAEVWVQQMVGGSGATYDLAVCVQEPGRPVDVSVLAYWVGHPAALRKTIFALEELEPMNVRESFGFKRRGGYGMPMRGKGKDEFEEFAPSPEQPDETIKAWVQDVLGRRVGR